MFKLPHSFAHFTLLLFSCQVVSDCLQPHGLQHARLPCPSLSPGVAQTHVHWVDVAIQPFHPLLPLLLLPSVFPSFRVFPVSRLFATGGQSVGASASGSVFLMNIQDWFPLGLTDLILLSEGLSRVFSSSTASVLQHSAFFMVQLSHPYLTPGKTIALTIWTFVGKMT